MSSKHEPFYREGSLSSKFSSSSKYLLRNFNPRIGGRSPQDSARLIIFYVVFYTALAFISMCCWWVFCQRLDPRIPTHQTSESLIGTNPGLGFRPLPSSEENVLSSLIWYRGTNRSSFEFWTNSLTNFLEVYKKPGLTPGRGQNIFTCDYDRPPTSGHVCDVDVKSLGPCTEENFFMYHQSGPCILLKLNKIYGWKPEFYNDTRNLPDDMPQNITDTIYRYSASNDIAARARLNTIWVSCRGESPADEEHIGSIRYHPTPGFPGYFFPYENSEGYLSPLVAVQFVRPRTGILINVECRAWARNIKYDQKKKQGSVHFELMID